MAHFFDYFILYALAFFICLSLGRTLILKRRGIRVQQGKRRFTDKLEFVLGATCMLARSYEIVAYTLSFPIHIGPSGLGVLLVDSTVAKVAGAVMWFVALMLYALALKAFGDSWRIGIDPANPRGLVTRGIFEFTRNPIFVSFMLMAVGTFLIMGRLIFLLLAAMSVILLYRQIRREEQFLLSTYGDAYRDYCARVGRFAKWF